MGSVLVATVMGAFSGLGGGLLAQCERRVLWMWVVYCAVTPLLWLCLWLGVVEIVEIFGLPSWVRDIDFLFLNATSATLSWIVVRVAAALVFGRYTRSCLHRAWPIRLAATLACLAMLAPWLGQNGTWPPSSRLLFAWVALLGAFLPVLTRSTTGSDLSEAKT